MEFGYGEHPQGEALGVQGFDQLVEHAEAVCACERLRIEFANEPLIVAKKGAYAAELETDDELKRRIYQAKPTHEERARRRRIAYCWAVASVLVVAGFVLSLLTLEPYRLGLKALLYCLGIAIATPFLVETALHKLSSEKLLRVLVTISSIGALLAVMVLAVIRGQLLVTQMQRDSSAVVIEGEEPSGTQRPNTFYGDTVPLLQIAMVLLAFSMEVGAGIAVHEAERLSSNLGESHDELQHMRKQVQARLASLAQEILALQNEPAVFVAKFWRDFHWAILKRSIGNLRKVFMIGLLAIPFVCSPRAMAQQPLELVVLLDLSRSTAMNGPDGRSEFQKNVTAVSRLLKQVPAGAHLTIVGVTDESFADPDILLSATVAGEEGYFGEKLAAARRRLEIAWSKRSQEITPSFAGTDLLGALLAASQIFERAGNGRHHVLVIVSDMWQETRELDFRGMSRACNAPGLVEKVRGRKLFANLRGVDVYAIGVDSVGRTKREWECAREFWAKYFAEAGANLREYTVLRSVNIALLAGGTGP